MGAFSIQEYPAFLAFPAHSERNSLLYCFCGCIGRKGFSFDRNSDALDQPHYGHIRCDGIGIIASFKDVMKDKPRKRGSEHVNKIGNWAYFKEQWKLGAFIINKPMLGEILSVGIFFFVLLFAFLLIFQHADINSMTDF